MDAYTQHHLRAAVRGLAHVVKTHTTLQPPWWSSSDVTYWATRAARYPAASSVAQQSATCEGERRIAAEESAM